MSKVGLEYVVSAIGMAGVLNNKFIKSPYFNTHIVPAVNATVDTVKRDVKAFAQHTDPTVTMLFNAYTEGKFIEHITDYNRFHMDAVYADSGGLQMVTAGKTVTTEMKKKIYEVQTHSDYAMCFDVIPLESVSLTRSRNERSNVGNKIFDQSRHQESGRLTGLNIKAQIEHFKEKGAKTKVIIIVQGNIPEDMVLFYREIQNQLSNDDFDYVGGIAVADTCMGNKARETIDMMIGARMIAEFAHPNALNQLHLLGVGSIPRMAPVLYLRNSGFLDAYKKISYDSSSHTVCFNYGLMKLDGGCKPQGSTRNPKIEATLGDIYSTFEPVFKPVGTLDWFMDNIFFCPETGSWSHSNIINRVIETDDPRHHLGAVLSNFTYSMYQVKNFINNLDKVAGGDYIGMEGAGMSADAIKELKEVTDFNTMNSWLARAGDKVSSARIKRKEDAFGLDKFFV